MEPNTNDALWRVQLATGEVRTMTLDALDRAFDEGHIDARVFVLAPGSTSWTTLGEAAGLDSPLDTQDQQPASVEAMPSLMPVAMGSGAPSSSVNAAWNVGDLDSDLDFAPPRRRGRWIGGLVVAGVVAAAAVLSIGKLAGGSTANVALANAAIAAPPPAPEPLPEAAPVAKDAKPVLSDWQKKMLLDSDKARDEKARAKTHEKAAKGQKRRKGGPKAGPALANGGDKFDPLNGQL